MYAIIYGRRLTRVPAAISAASQFLAHFSSRNYTSDFSGGDATFTISYLTTSCGLSFDDAASASKKLCIKSTEKPDSILELFKKHGFTNAQISRTVTKWPAVLKSSAEKTLSPKIEFFLSIGVPSSVLAENLSKYPFLFGHSYRNYFIPWYNYLKSIVQSDKNVATILLSSPRAFNYGWPKRAPSNIAILRERGVSEHSIASLLVSKPSMMILRNEKFAACVDRAEEMGFEKSKPAFVRALQVFGGMSESTLKHKMDVYRMCGWSESDLTSAFLKYPLCMKLSEKKIRVGMGFLVKEMGLKAADVARCPVILDYSCEGRMKPRWIVVRILRARGLMKGSVSIIGLFKMSESSFVEKFITDYEKKCPQLLDIYRGKISPSEIGSSDENLVSK